MTTYITFVLDETGSMQSMCEEAISGFNKYIDTLSDEIKGRTNFSLLLFDSAHKTWVVNGESVKNVKHLNEDTYRPGAATPLWDAVAEAIDATKERIKRTKNPDVILTVLTDGEENASEKHTAEEVRSLIGDLDDDWAFNFIGVGVDAWHAQSMGIAAGATMSFRPGAGGLIAGLAVATAATVRYANAPTRQKQALNKSFYVDIDEEEKE